MNQFGNEVKKMLVDKGLTQKELSEKMALSHSGLTNALNRDNISIKQMQAIAHALNCDLKIELIPKNDE